MFSPVRILLLMMVCLLAGCGSSLDTATSPAPSAPAAAAETVQARVGVALAATPNNITFGQTVTLKITGARPSAWTYLYLKLPSGSTYSYYSVYTDTAGSASYGFRPPSTAGTWRAYAIDGDGTYTSTVAFGVNAANPSPTPTPTPTPSPTPAGFTVSLPTTATTGQTVTIRLTGATPNTAISVYKQAPAGYYYMDYPTADATGTATVQWNTSNYPTGAWTVFAYCQGSYSNRSTLQLNAGTPAGLALSLSPTSIPAGGYTTARITGATPNSSVRLMRVQYGLSGGSPVAYLTADSSGGVTYSYYGFTSAYRGTSWSLWVVDDTTGQASSRTNVSVY